MKYYTLSKFEDWADFDRIADFLEVSLGWESQQKAEGPDARSWSFVKKEIQIWLVFDDVMGMALKCERGSFYLEDVNGVSKWGQLRC
jgi:hypothetical protein